MISDEYRKLNEELHAQSAEYGSGSGQKYAGFVLEAMRRTGSSTVLDYGCGKGTLWKALGSMVRNYDPAVPEWSATPDPADLVVCTDVLEHVEPEHLDDVLGDIRRLARKAAFLVISCRPATKTLPDGRNAHLTVESPAWWLKKVSKDFKVLVKHEGEDSLMVVCK